MKLLVKSPGERKLAGIKFLMRMTDLSFRDCKTLYETNNFSVTIKNDKVLFDELIRDCDFQWSILDTPEKKRIEKFVELGLADKEDIIDLLLDYDWALIGNFAGNYNYLKGIYLLLDKHELTNLYKQRKEHLNEFETRNP